MTTRDFYRRKSNNSQNPNKNICVLAVADYFGVSDLVHYLHRTADLVNAVRKTAIVRSRTSYVKKLSIAGARNKMRELTSILENNGNWVVGYIVRVHGHVLLLDKVGQPRIDTSPRKVDRRKIMKLYVVYRDM